MPQDNASTLAASLAKDEEKSLSCQHPTTTADDRFLKGLPLALCLLAIMMSMFLAALDSSVIGTILEEIGADFGDFANMTWIVSGYMLSVAVFTVTWGKLATIVGRKSSLLGAILIFEIGNLVAALSRDMNMLIVGRVISGIGGGGIQTLVGIVGSDIVPTRKRGMIQGYLGLSFTFASIAGPLIGGSLGYKVTWRWCFYINLPCGGVAALAFFFLYKPPAEEAGCSWRKLKSIDYLGILLLSIGLTFFLLALSFGSIEQEWDTAQVISFFIIGGFFAIAFGLYNALLSSDPLIPRQEATSVGVMAAVTCAGLVFMLMMTLMLYVAVYFEVIRGMNPLNTGLHMLPVMISTIVGAFGSGFLSEPLNRTKPLVVGGTCVAMVGAGLFTMLDRKTSLGQQIGYMIPLGIGIGALFQSLLLAAQIATPSSEYEGIAITTGLNYFGRALGGVLGSTIGGVILFHRLKVNLSAIKLPKGLTPLMIQNQPSCLENLPSQVKDPIVDAYCEAIQTVFQCALAFAGLAILVGLFTTNRKLTPEETQQEDKQRNDCNQAQAKKS